MTLLQAVCWILLIFAALAVLCAAVIWAERKFPGKKYDERQMLARGKAYRLALAVSTVYFTVVGVYLTFHTGEDLPVEPYILIFFGIVLQAQVCHIYCLLTHAALPLGEKPGVAITCYFALGILYLIQCLRWESLTFTGLQASAWGQLLCAVTFLELGAIHLFRVIWYIWFDKE